MLYHYYYFSTCLYPFVVARLPEAWPTSDNTMIPALGGAAALATAGSLFGRWLSFPPDEEDDPPEERERKKFQRRRLLAASAGHLGVAFVIFAGGYLDATRIFPPE